MRSGKIIYLLYILQLYIIMLIIGGCSTFSRTQTISMSPLPKVENQFQPKLIWKLLVGDNHSNIYSNLHLAWKGAYIFAANRCSIVKAIDINTGREIWSNDFSMPINLLSHKITEFLSGGLTVEGDKLYFGSELAKLYALNIYDGKVIWETHLSGEVLSSPVVSNGIVLVHNSNGILQAINNFDGTVKWSIRLNVPLFSLRGESAPAIAFDTAIIGDDNGCISAVLLNQGQIIWQQRISNVGGETEVERLKDVQTTPVVINGVVYAVSYNGNLAAMDLYSGKLIWSNNIGSISDLLVNNSLIYLIDQTDCLMSISAVKGLILWRQDKLLHRSLTSPVLYKNYIITGDAEGYLHWIDPKDGHFIVQHKVDNSGILSQCVVAGDKLIVQAKNGKVYAFTN